VNLEEIHLLPKTALALVVVRTNKMTEATANQLAAAIMQKNRSAMVVYLDPETTLETVDHSTAMSLVAGMTDRLDNNDLSRLGLKRIIC
jgi:hypothetical protein